ncbi:hypothetical protein GOV11_04495 [Candidatus Woesearchaeota archaeon]|nr:hypothetical protein [Candidatus Woesearchaeota archaeon]
MNITTIKLRKATKARLDAVKDGDESYDEAIGRILTMTTEEQLKENLIEGYKSRAEDLELMKDWDVVAGDGL